MHYFTLQASCFAFILYIAFSYYFQLKESFYRFPHKKFKILIILSLVTIFFDGLTAWSVNNQNLVPENLNLALHFIFFLCVNSMIFYAFVYIIKMSNINFPWKKKIIMHTPYAISVIFLSCTINKLFYMKGPNSYYSYGTPVKTCYVVAALYIAMSSWVCFRHMRVFEKNKQVAILTYLISTIAVLVMKLICPDLLITACVPVIFILCAYISEENPNLKESRYFYSEMVVGFTNIAENKDKGNALHIIRTKNYVEAIVLELRRQGYYKEVLTKDFINSLSISTPMYDIGKVSIKDEILNKSGKLTTDQFEQVKNHTKTGGKIVENTFSKLANKQFVEIAYNITKYHHEKWNGQGYPEGLKFEDIPLAARIVTVADVFDAISQDQSYRKALPLEECFKVIEDGIGVDFDPVIAGVFLDIRSKIEDLFNSFKNN